jgi:hypothetical protein
MSIASFFNKPSAKRPREQEEAMPGAPKPHVRTMVCWNANSLINRISHDRSALTHFLRSHAPDVIFISEVRSPAHGRIGCKKGDGQPRQHGTFSRATPALSKEADTILAFCREYGYRSYWSLAEYKYAGTGLLVRAACAQPNLLRYTLNIAARADEHHPEGRVILASFGWSLSRLQPPTLLEPRVPW